MNTMKAIRLHSYGGPELLKYEDVAKPQPQENEVLVRIHAASVNPIDWMMESGQYEPMRPQLPYVPGWDFAGKIEAVGSKVTNFQVEDEIYANVGATGGGYADYAIANVDAIAPKPKTLDFTAAAAVPLVALTAWQALFEAANLSEGQTVLIHGASGGVGSMAVQFAKARGARVIGTASASNVDFVRDLGADRVINYKSEHFEEELQDIDVVFDTVGGETQEKSWQVLKPNGVLVSVIQPPDEEKAKAHQVRAQFLGSHPSGTQLSEIAKLIDAGGVKPIVDRVLPLSEARQAQEFGRDGHPRGKIVLQVVG
ncbi:MAG: NADP-dependent oxidoreductase [Xenococcaceae cyanobacterium]